MSNAPFTFESTARTADGTLIPFFLAVSAAVIGPEDAYRTCRCQAIEDRTWDIYGMDEAQALFLSIRFMREMVEHKGLTLERPNGAPNDIPFPPETAPYWPENDPDHV